MWADLESEVAAEFGAYAEQADDEVQEGLEARASYERERVAAQVKEWRAKRRLRDPEGHNAQLEKNRAYFAAWAVRTGRKKPAAQKKRKARPEVAPEAHNVLAQRMAGRKAARKQRVSK